MTADSSKDEAPFAPHGSYASWSRVERFLSKHQAATLRLNGRRAPRVDYVISESGNIALHLQLGPRHRVPHSPLPLVRIEEIAYEGLRMARVRLTQDRLMRDFHDLLNSVADRIVVHGRTPDQAFNETLRAWTALLQQPRAISAEKRIGLLGELTVMNSLADKFGWDIATAAWKGPEGEEHDFGLPGFDVEVKSTAAEVRVHTVHGLGQLTPTPGRPLWLVSVQLTRGGPQDRTLSDCINAVRGRIGEAAPESVTMFDQYVSSSGWSPNAPDDEHWSLRNTPLVLAADERLPRLDHSLLDSLPAEIRGLVTVDRYRINVTHLAPASDAPPALHAFRLP